MIDKKKKMSMRKTVKMEIFEHIRKRRSVYPHQFNTQKIEDEVIQELLEMANWAPTHKKTEPWRFRVLSGDSKQKAGSFFKDVYLKTTEQPKKFKAKKIKLKFEQSSHVIAICMQRDASENIPEWEEVAATSMAVQNMWLASRSLGVGMYWSSPTFKDHLGDFIDLEDGEKCLGFLYMGKFDEDVEELKRQSPIQKKTHWYR